jgi:hypothetical protein
MGTYISPFLTINISIDIEQSIISKINSSFNKVFTLLEIVRPLPSICEQCVKSSQMAFKEIKMFSRWFPQIHPSIPKSNQNVSITLLVSRECSMGLNNIHLCSTENSRMLSNVCQQTHTAPVKEASSLNCQKIEQNQTLHPVWSYNQRVTMCVCECAHMHAQASSTAY